MKKILIVEDEESLRSVYVMLFELEKFDVNQAINGKEAIKLLQKYTPDLIILDVLMPVMSGIDFLRKIKPKENYPNVKILVLSNLSDSKTLQEINELGATEYLLKSDTSPKELLEAATNILAS